MRAEAVVERTGHRHRVPVLVDDVVLGRVASFAEGATSCRWAGARIADFIAANADVDAWLLLQPGFISRRIVQGAGGVVVDMLIWSSAKAGENAARRPLADLPGSPVHDAIDQRTVSWNVSPVFHQLERWRRRLRRERDGASPVGRGEPV